MSAAKLELPEPARNGLRYVRPGEPLTIGITLAELGLDIDEGGLRLGNNRGEPTLMQRRDYDRLLHELGANVIALLPTTDPEWAVKNCHGFIFAGGHDPDMSVFGLPPINGTEGRYVDSAERTKMELDLLDYMATNPEGMRPVLGVCYGSQILALSRKGRLAALEGHEGEPHTVDFTDNFLGITAGDTVHVSSRHGLHVAHLPDEFRPVASHDGVLEAYVHLEYPYYGIQTHPETPLSNVYVAQNGCKWIGPELYGAFLLVAYNWEMTGQDIGRSNIRVA